MKLSVLREGPQANGVAPLVLVHALGADQRCFNSVLDELAYPSVIAVELPGHGGAPVLDLGRPVMVADLYARLMAELDALGVAEFHLAGISIGGLLTWFAATQPGRRLLSATVLCSKPALLPSEMWWERASLVREQGLDSLVEPTLQRWFTPDFYALNSSAVQVTRAGYQQCNPVGYAQCCEVLATTDLRELPVLVPVFHLAAAQFDAGALPQDLADAYAVVAKLDAQHGLVGDRFYSVIEGAAHMASVEQPLQVANLITRSIEATGR